MLLSLLSRINGCGPNDGVSLRRWLKTLAIEQIADFGDLPVFDEATTYPSIISVHAAVADRQFQAVQIDTLLYADGLANHIEANRQSY